MTSITSGTAEAACQEKNPWLWIYEELVHKAEQLGLSAADLHSTIDDAAAELARRTTQEGLAMQLRFLSRDCGWSKSKIEERIRGAHPEQSSASRLKSWRARPAKLGLEPARPGRGYPRHR